MKIKHLKVVVGVICLVASGVLIFHAGSGADSSGVEKSETASQHPSSSVRSNRVGDERETPDLSAAPDPDSSQQLQEPRPLSLPILRVDEDSLREGAIAAAVSPSPRKILLDDDILAMGGVLPVPTKSATEDSKINQLKSIKSEDWKGEANLLVNALRAGEGFEVNHDELLAFISGKDLLGWPVGQRNWIGDELMTALRQDMPQSAFGDLKSIAENPAAPAAMRDYSVQHITHLMTSGVIGKEGADFIWQTVEKNEPQTLSTALISLQRLSEQVPDLVSTKQVQAAAESLKESPDERTRITAESILKAKP